MWIEDVTLRLVATLRVAVFQPISDDAALFGGACERQVIRVYWASVVSPSSWGLGILVMTI